MLLDLLVDQLFAQLPFGRRRVSPLPRVATPPPSELQVRTFRHRLAMWTKAHGLVPVDRAGTYEGILDGVRVSLRTGLEGSRPQGVELTLTVVHDVEAPELVTRDVAPKTALGRNLRRLFETTAAGVDGALRSVAIMPNAIRLRFAPATFPELIEEVLAEYTRHAGHVASLPYR